MAWQDISVEELLKLRDPLVVDVRSPCEHQAESIPGSHNVPLLSDEERALVGTIYKQQGDTVARRTALGMIAPKIPALLDAILSRKLHGQPLVVHCWRGGMRSESVCSVLSIAGIDSYRLAGGYKALRGHVLRELQADAYPFDPVVLVGLTGTGKTELLHLLNAKGLTVLDLEKLANHRGSVFGGIGLGAQPSQKDFDSALWNELRANAGKVVFLEGESRKIGRLALPDCVFNRINAGPFVLVKGSLRRRAERIASDYQSENPAEAYKYLLQLKERLGSKAIDELIALVETGEVSKAIEILLADYYDPLYAKQIQQCDHFALQVNSDHPESAANQIFKWSQERSRSCAVS